jgi:Na+/H+ antiporter NhaC
MSVSFIAGKSFRSFVGAGEELTGEYTYNLVRIVPYIIVLITALLGMNVIVVLLLGTWQFAVTKCSPAHSRSCLVYR